MHRFVQSSRTCLRKPSTLSKPRPTRRWLHDSSDSALDALEKDHAKLLRLVRRRIDVRNEAVDQTSNSSTEISKARYMKEYERLNAAWSEWTRARTSLLETSTYLSDEDPTMRALANEERASLLSTLSSLLTSTFPSLLLSSASSSAAGGATSQEEINSYSALIELKAGVGGSESSLFLESLTRTYTRFATLNLLPCTLLQSSPSDSGGLKYATLEIKGEGSYEKLRWESGVHRVQRVPVTETSGRTHTSTVAVVVLPLKEERGDEGEGEELFDMKDVRIEVMRARGAGGQHVNKTESAVRLTHEPSGITVSMQDTRSQHKNREKAFQVLRARLLDRKLLAEQQAYRAERRQLVKGADRSDKVRTYNFAQNRVTDHRIGLTLNGVQQVLDGEWLWQFHDALREDYEKSRFEDLLSEVGE
ncbi:release factor [Sistotremastrum suecicum HHB10207 ss-3]|uniref:Release factor n=1 Tax=Sistotremastrum suecicum HHB10207 ss-3 TaxID=1314776 RepID=A0A166ECV1_9AGAM|nr:release factor [Sistotremastrum suecicum HHB10207 ss-3]